MSDQPAVRFHIDELVLHGFAPSDRYRIADAVEREIGRLLTDRGLPAGWTRGDAASVDSVTARAFEVGAGARPERIGTQIAEAIYGGLGTGGGE